jgi:hypothetical protein
LQLDFEVDPGGTRVLVGQPAHASAGNRKALDAFISWGHLFSTFGTCVSAIQSTDFGGRTGIAYLAWGMRIIDLWGRVCGPHGG